MSKDELRAGCKAAVAVFYLLPPDPDNPLHGLLAVLAPDWLAANPGDDGDPVTHMDMQRWGLPYHSNRATPFLFVYYVIAGREFKLEITGWTKGRFRMLCRALEIPLPEPEAAK